MAEYKCKYCSQKFAKPLDLARHVRMNHKRAKKRAKKAAAKLEPAPMNKALEAMGVLKGLQASPNLSDEEKKLLGEVAKTVEAILPK
jgi:biotin synthase-like enzyme